jgi:hypothetical protein
MRLEGNAILVQLASRVQAEYLEPTTISQDRLVPVHETVQTTLITDYLVPWS